MYACICHAVTDVEVGAAVATGASSVKAIRKSTGAGGSCGSCVKRLSCMLAAYRDDSPANAADTVTAAIPEPTPAPVQAPAQAPARPQPARLGHLLGCPAGALALG